MIERRSLGELGGADHGWLKAKHRVSHTDSVERGDVSPICIQARKSAGAPAWFDDAATPEFGHERDRNQRLHEQDAGDNQFVLGSGKATVPVLAISGEKSFGPIMAAVMRAPRLTSTSSRALMPGIG
jgi:hypothetical protein